jgi:hypothetical protein
MIFAFGVIAALTLLLIFLFIKLQSSQKEVAQLRIEARKTLRHVGHVTASKDMLALTWQNTLVNRVIAAQKRALLSEQDAKVLGVVSEGFSDLLYGCLNEGRTLEEGLLRHIEDKDITLQDVKDVIKKYPKEVRLAWTKNNAEGLIVSFTKLSEMLVPSMKKNQQEPSADDKSEAPQKSA